MLSMKLMKLRIGYVKEYRNDSKITTLIGSQDVYLCSQKKWYKITQQ